MSHVRNLLRAQALLKPTSFPVAHLPSVFAFPEPSHEAREATPAAAPVSSPGTVEEPLPPEYPVEQVRLTAEHRIVSYSDPHSPVADRFRYIRMRLREFSDAGKLKKLLITSALPGEGKTTVILNLATTLAERGQRSVLLLDADLHKSCLAEKLGLKASIGLAECLQGADPLRAIRRIEPCGWYLLPAGEPPSNPTELLQSRALVSVMEKLSSHFDWILIDSPPSLLLTDAITLQAIADATLLVVRAGQTPRDAVASSFTLLGEKNIVAVVLNEFNARHNRYQKYQSTE